MYHRWFTKKLNRKDHFGILLSLLALFNLLTFIIYSFIRLLFYNHPFSAGEEIATLLNSLLVGSIGAIGMYLVLLFLECIDYLLSNHLLRKYKATAVPLMLLSLLIILLVGF